MTTYGIRIPPCAPISTVAETARNAEANHFDHAWFPDSQLLWRDAYMAILESTHTTEEIGLGTAVSSIDTRHLTVLASMVRTLTETAGTRVRVGVGAGASSVVPLGLGRATTAELRAAILGLRQLLAGEEWTAPTGAKVTMRDADVVTPILMAATGPRRLQLAGEVADGVIFHCGTDVGAVERAIKEVEAGAERAGRSIDDVSIVVSGVCLVTDDLAGDVDLLRPIYMTILQDGGAGALAAAGLQVAEMNDALAKVDFKHAEDWAAAMRRAGGLTTETLLGFASQFCFAGTLLDIGQQLKELEQLGVDEVLFQGLESYELPNMLIDQLSALLAPSHGA